MHYKITNIDTGEYYYASNIFSARDDTDKAAIEEAIRLKDVITMGHTIVTPEYFFNKEEKHEMFQAI